MWPPTRLIPWFSKAEGNTYATLLHHPSSSRENQCSAQEVARRISGAVAGEVCAKSSQDIPSTHHKLLSLALYYLAFASSFPSPPLHLCRFIRPLFLFASFSLASCLLVCWIACLSRWLEIIPNYVTLPIPTIMISLALRWFSLKRKG